MQHLSAGEEACCLRLFFPHLADLHVGRVEELGSGVLIAARSRVAEAACHRCGVPSARVHSRYQRRLHDLAVGGQAVTISLEVRRFFCGNPVCGLRPSLSRCPRWRCGISAGHRCCAACWKRSRWLWPAGPDHGWPRAWHRGLPVTLTRLIRALPDPVTGQVTVLGVDLSRSRDYPDWWCGEVVDAVAAGGLVAVRGPPGSG